MNLISLAFSVLSPREGTLRWATRNKHFIDWFVT
jgi:hypothetical protein